MSAFQPLRLFEIFQYQQQYYPQDSAIGEWQENKWQSYSTDQCLRDIQALAIGMHKLGWVAGDRVGIQSQLGSYAWVITDAALQMNGLIPVPLHASATQKQLAYILKDAEISTCFVADHEHSQVLSKAIQEQQLEVSLFSFSKNEKLNHWSSIFADATPDALAALNNRAQQVDPEKMATIIYTSGTTGNPKGVMLSHKNILSNILSTIVLIPVNAEDTALSYLPMSHIFERMVIYSYLMCGTSIYFSRSVNTILEDLKAIRPHYFTSVPRLLERVYERIMLESAEGSMMKRRLVKWSIRVGEKWERQRGFSPWLNIQRMLADGLVYRRWRNEIGGRVKGVIVGAAAMQPRLGRLFSTAKIKIREGYGLTETSPVIAFNRFEPGGYQFGTVGIPIPGIELKIQSPDEEGIGEVVVRGPNVMLGYYQQKEQTQKVLSEDGWFSTGDTGKLIQKHFLQISGRKKDLFKTTTGKYVAPFHVENTLKGNIFISQCMVLGANMPYPGALIIPNFERLKPWCLDNNVHWTSPQFMVLNPKVVQLYQQLIQKCNKELSKEEKVRRFYLLHEEWSIPTGEYGPTLKLIRPVIREKYSSTVEELFGPKGLTVPQ